MAEDKNTIGLTEANKATMDAMVERGGFKTGLDAAKFALSVAIARNSDPTPVEKAGTIWNVGSFDDTGELKALVRSIFPDTKTPYRVIESLVNVGFNLLASDVAAGGSGLRIEDLIRREL